MTVVMQCVSKAAPRQALIVKPMLLGGFTSTLESLSKHRLRAKPLLCDFATLAEHAKLADNHGLAVHNGVLGVPDEPGFGLPQDLR